MEYQSIIHGFLGCCTM